MTTRTRRAYAKINLTLDVGARRPDGYHQICSVMQTIGLHDTLTVTLTPASPGVRLEISGEESAGVPSDESNIVHKAVVRLQKIAAARGQLPGNHSGLMVSLHKRIPAQAGLGGGSSDAAAALLAVNDLFGLRLPQQRLAEIGAALGADVPFFLVGGTALAEGLGERVAPLPALTPSWPLVIVKPQVGVSTPTAYAALDAVPERTSGMASERWLRGEQIPQNDFEAVIFPAYTEVRDAYSFLIQTAQTEESFRPPEESFRPLLCGSGAALFLRTADDAEAERIAAIVRAAHVGKVWVTRTQEAER